MRKIIIAGVLSVILGMALGYWSGFATYRWMTLQERPSLQGCLLTISALVLFHGGNWFYNNKNKINI